MFVNDVSDSMKATDVRPSRLVAAKRAATSFLSDVTPTIEVGSIEFARHVAILQSPTTDHRLTRAASRRSSPAAEAPRWAMRWRQALTALEDAPKIDGKRPPGAMILISDGASNVGVDPVAVARVARKRHVPIYTVSIGTPNGTIQLERGGHTVTSAVPVDPTELRQIAAASGGHAYRAPNSTTVKSIYAHLAKQLGERRVHRQLDAVFAGVALALLAAGIAVSLLWFGRLT